MKIIIPMAGRGTRLRPHTLTTPKPMLPIAGKPIVHRLIDEISDSFDKEITDIAFIIGDFGEEVERGLLEVAEAQDAKGHIFYQKQALGTAHAIWQAKSLLNGEVVVAFADTLFKANFELDESKDGVIWVKQVENPSAFGVVTLDQQGIIQKMVEKPAEFVSDLAIIGIYYFKKAEGLYTEIQYLLDNDIREKGEFQLTNALSNLKDKGAQFVPGKVDAWMDCGNKDAVLDTQKQTLGYLLGSEKNDIHPSAEIENSLVIPPCYIGKAVSLKNTIVGPFVSIGDNSKIRHSVISMALVQEEAEISNVVLHKSMIGNQAVIQSPARQLDVGDYTKIR